MIWNEQRTVWYCRDYPEWSVVRQSPEIFVIKHKNLVRGTCSSLVEAYEAAEILILVQLNEKEHIVESASKSISKEGSKSMSDGEIQTSVVISALTKLGFKKMDHWDAYRHELNGVIVNVPDAPTMVDTFFRAIRFQLENFFLVNQGEFDRLYEDCSEEVRKVYQDGLNSKDLYKILHARLNTAVETKISLARIDSGCRSPAVIIDSCARDIVYGLTGKDFTYVEK